MNVDLALACARVPAEAVDPLYDRLSRLASSDERAAREPNDLDDIRALRPDGPRDLAWVPTDKELIDHIHGAWIGRSVGCALGKPVEAIGSSGGREDPGLGRRRIRAYLEARGDWPLRDFFSGDPTADGVELECPQSQRENVAFMEPDDDIHYTLAGLGVLESVGPGFGWQDIAWWWLGNIPTAYACTAELQALHNLMERSVRGRSGPATAEWTRGHRNPYREWIGAQIRGRLGVLTGRGAPHDVGLHRQVHRGERARSADPAAPRSGQGYSAPPVTEADIESQRQMSRSGKVSSRCGHEKYWFLPTC
ncbi:MAG: hypothetical protein ACYDGR_11385 [Candidatus Dormibacteria bacterium]